MKTKKTKSSKNKQTIYGKVSNAQGKPLAGLKVMVYAVGMRDWQALGSAMTNAQGTYKVSWTPQQSAKANRTLGVKVFTSPKNTEVYKSEVQQMRFQAAESQQMNIRIRQPLPIEEIEFGSLSKKIKKLAGGVAIADLKESDTQRDISFLARELAVPAQKIEWMVVAYRLKKLSGVGAAFFYALFRTRALLHTGQWHALHSIGLHTRIQPLLYEVVLADPAKIKAAIAQAVAVKVVGLGVNKKVKGNLKKLAQFQQEAQDYRQNDETQRRQEWLHRLFEANDTPIVSKENSKENEAENWESTAQNTRSLDPVPASVWGALPALGKEVMAGVAQKHRLKTPADFRQLARFNKADWVEEISQIKPQLTHQQLISNYASLIVRRFEQQFPTTAFAAQLEREKATQLSAQPQLIRFFQQNPDFDLRRHRIDTYLKKAEQNKKLAPEDRQVLRAELKALQRVFRLTPRYSQTLALRAQNIHSAHQLVSKGKNHFLNEIAPKVGLSEREAHQVYQNAQNRQTATMLMLGNLHDQASVRSIASFETSALEKATSSSNTTSSEEDFPDLQTLFGGGDSCECQHCRSVYSPAAYLVEILQFLEQRSVRSGNALSVLFGRRSDLGDIDLSCANANTPVKYIDLVCELLEEAIAPTPAIAYTGVLAQSENQLTGLVTEALLGHLQKAGLPVTAEAMIYPTDTITDPEDKDNTLLVAPYYLRDVAVVCKIEQIDKENFQIYRLRQTLSTAEALAAAPEYVNDEAYEALRSSSYAFALPFDLHHTEAQAYFSRFGVQRADLMEAFRTLIETEAEDEEAQAQQRDFVIACEQLGLTKAEANLIVTASSDEAAQQAVWNVPEDYTVLAYLAQVDHFLDRTGLSYEELELLLKLEFIDPEGNLFIQHNDSSCDLAQKEIANLDLEALDRMHRFLRLQKKTGWEATLLNQMMIQAKVGDGELNNNCLIRIAQANTIADKTKWSLEALMGCFDEFPHTIYNHDDPKPLYYQIFLNEARNGSINEDFLPENVATGDLLLDEHKEYIATCLQITTQDMGLLLAALSNEYLNFTSLSNLYVASLLMKTYSLSAADFVALTEMVDLAVENRVEEVLKFVKVIEDFQASPLAATDVAYLLTHEASDLEAREMSEATIASLLETLATAYQEIEQTYASQFDSSLSVEEQQATFLQVVSAVSGATAEEAQTIYGFARKEWETVEAAKDFVAEAFDEAIDLGEINIALDALDAATTDEVTTNTAQQNLLEAIFNAVATFQINTAQRTTLLETLSEAFETDANLVEAVLTFAQFEEQAMSEVLMGKFAEEGDQEGALQLLHKMLYLIDAFGLDSAAVAWLLQHSLSLGGFALDALPYDADQTAIDFAQYLGFLKIANWAQELSPVANPTDAQNPLSFFSLMELLLVSSEEEAVEESWDSDGFMRTLALLTGYEKEDLVAVGNGLFAGADATTYQNINHLSQLLEAAALVRKIGATTAQISSFIQPTLGSDEVATLRAVLKARYDENTWLVTLEEIMDAIRPQKRDALVAYLLATDAEITDANDLYDQYLIDVEMGACMPSSRIVQAHNSVQLFVQRCLMGLEPEAIAEVETDLGWKQWEWMKNYRVWEANRKVFLYPENWYEVPLTSDPSYLLTECIDELQQNELTNDTAEQALTNYLEKLDDISFLQVAATWYDVPSYTMHVFARTKGGDPAIYYYRRFEKERYWTPWEKIEVDITGDHLLAFVRNNRLHLVWAMFSEEPDPAPQQPETSDEAGEELPKPQKKLKIQLALSVYTNNQWQPKRVSREAILTPEDYTDVATVFEKERYTLAYVEHTGQIHVFGRMPEPVDTKPDTDEIPNKKIGIFNLKGCKGYPEVANEVTLEEHVAFTSFLPDFEHTELMAQKYQETDKSNSVATEAKSIETTARKTSSYRYSDDIGNEGELPDLDPNPDIDPDAEPSLPTDGSEENPGDTPTGEGGVDNTAEELSDALAIRNIIYPLVFEKILGKTPDRFTLSYPHQTTPIDEWYFKINPAKINEATQKPSLGAYLPYFKEDSNRAYVIVPGYYHKNIENAENPEEYTIQDHSDKRTASDILQNLEEFIEWLKNSVNPPEGTTKQTTEEALHEAVSDPQLHQILTELSHYGALGVLPELLTGVALDGNPAKASAQKVDEDTDEVPDYVPDEDADTDSTWEEDAEEEVPLSPVYGEQLKPLYHPLVCALKTALYGDGVAGLMQRDTQLKNTDFSFENNYQPNPKLVAQLFYPQATGEPVASYPIEDLDFSSDGSYSVYNWDLFFRLPLHIATSLSQNQRFEEALEWFHYIFNPTGALGGEGVQKYWVTKPFYLHQTEDYDAQSIESLLYASASGSSADLEFAIAEWRDKPFEPDVVARYRPVAYQKAVLMQYLDNLIAWGDYLFRQDTMEALTQATQMYILADKLLGAKPKEVKPVVKPPYETYHQLAAKLGSFGNALIELESLLPDLSALPEGGEELPSETTLSMLYFCVPTNEKMLEYWDTIADRLFKIRNCQNIDGVERSLALFAPPIDPGMLVKAKAAGLSLSAVLAGANAPLPYYRFQVLAQKATELTQEVRSLGNALLQALEKRDAEALSLLRNQLELKVLNAVTDIKQLQIEEAEEQIEVLNKTRVVTEERYAYYRDIEGLNDKEKLNLDRLKEANKQQDKANKIYALGATLALIPDLALGFSGFGGSPHGAAKFGGSFLAHATDAAGKIVGIKTTTANYEANRASITGGHQRRWNDWKLQETLAEKELESIDQQIVAAELRKEIAETDLKNHELQIENAQKTDDFMRAKFSNKELYDWMVKQISGVYFKAYQLAHDFAKKAERCYQFELGNNDTFIAYGYWDSLKKGLQSGDHLMHDLKRMETSYLDKNKRAYQLTKHVSLALLDPLALVKLKETGVCDFTIPEALFDMDHAGHYFRRLKSVSISLPCIAGPYTSVSAKLSLVSNKYRKDKSTTSGYEEDLGNDSRFAYNIGAIQSIATSHAQNDSGMFELNFRDERYLPFEGTGAISTWRLELPEVARQFDYSSIADVVLHLKYTAREGGSGLKNAANAALQDQLNTIAQALGKTGLHTALNLKHDLPNEWQVLTANGSVNLTIDSSRLPYMAQALGANIESVMFLVKGGVSSIIIHEVGVNPSTLSDEVKTINLNSHDDFGELKIGDTQAMEIPYTVNLGTPFMLSCAAGNLEELVLVVGYSFEVGGS